MNVLILKTSFNALLHLLLFVSQFINF